MYDFRYHIASIVAVFLALSIGLLLGSAVTDRGMISDQTDELVASLQAQFDDITAANQQLSLGIKRDSAFAEDAVPVLVTGKLEGEGVVVLTSPGRVDGLDAVTSAIKSAGGSAVVVTLAQADLGLDTEAPDGLVSYFEKRGIDMASPGQALEQQVAGLLASEWRAGGLHPLTTALTSAGLLKPASLPEKTAVDAIVLMGPSASGIDGFSLACAKAMVAAGGVAVAAEASPSDKGVAVTAANAGFSALDHATTPQGKFALVWLLAGRATGYYGSGSGTAAYYPSLTSGQAG